MTYKFDSHPIIGYPPIEVLQPSTAPSTGTPWPPATPGLIVNAEDPVWGVGEFVFGQFNGAVPQYALCILTPVWNGTTRTFNQMFTVCPNTANQGRAVFVAMAESGTVGAVSGQFGWFMSSGIVPVSGTASVAAGTGVGITAAGQIGAIGAGKAILGAVSAQAATATVVKAAAGAGNANQSGNTAIQVHDVDGLFVGGYLSGTGVGTNAIITAIDRIGMVLTVSVANSAQVTGNVTQTNNNATIFYNEVALYSATAQGPIT